MNKIYIINNTINDEVTLNFKNNTFDIENVSYKFNLIEKDKLLVFWTEFNNQILYTDDSYIYYSDIKFKNIFKKIFLIHSDWYDQAIINFDKMSLHRIGHKEQYGNITYNDDSIIIYWNFWGKEKYIKNDNYTYVQENYIVYDKTLYPIIPIHIFIHICMIADWKNIFEEQIKIIKSSGLYNITEKIHLGILGDFEKLNDSIFNDKKFDILYIDKRVELYEIHTINFIKSFCDSINEEIYILYIHTKGVRNAGNKKVIESWRNMMEYFLIKNHENCLKYLSNYDTVGNNIINMHCYNKNDVSINETHTYHYSGNFWWSKKTYIDKLDYISLDLTKNAINTRYKAENWILSNYPEAKIGTLFQDDTNTHPYHRYVFDYYKEMKIIIKKLI